ncbi:uncharacterized protein HKW66_Vig0046300 [Vigna angularis]|uniref:Uncharacterized protein n=1 Tax=Phaseolus angularis TaxID=3914 RepID=A0A8T0L5V9_PHAAN|nr:uncharacterized protein HKW66_Vig0046300 [Vigna angularis]
MELQVFTEAILKIKHSNDTCGFSNVSFTKTSSFLCTTSLVTRTCRVGGQILLRPPRDGDLPVGWTPRRKDGVPDQNLSGEPAVTSAEFMAFSPEISASTPYS